MPSPAFDFASMALDSAPPQPMLSAPGGGLSYVRDLVEADLDNLEAQAAPSRPYTSIIKRLTATHHNMARLLADGKSTSEVAALMGKSYNSISTLKDDPALAELVSHYSKVKDTLYYDMHARLATMGINAAEILNDKLEAHLDSGSGVPLRDAQSVLEMVLDRSGFHATSEVLHSSGPDRASTVRAEVEAMFTKRTKGVFIESTSIEVEDETSPGGSSAGGPPPHEDTISNVGPEENQDGQVD